MGKGDEGSLRSMINSNRIKNLLKLNWPATAAGILIVFLVVQMGGYREFTGIIAGTGAYNPGNAFRGMVYIILYFASVVVVPVYLLAFLLLNIGNLLLDKARKKDPNQSDAT
jgi:hypothetical protein